MIVFKLVIKFWKSWAKLLEKLVGVILFSFIFWIIVVPTGVFVKLFRLSSIDQKWVSKKSYYIKRNRQFEPKDFEHLF